MMENRCEMRLTLPADLTLQAIAQVLHQSDRDDYYVYERSPCWHLGLGIRASLSIDGAGEQVQIVSPAGMQRCRMEAIETPAQIARRFLAEHAQHAARVFGEAGFHYALRTRMQTYSPGRWPILTLTVPRDEIIFNGDSVTIIADDRVRCCQLCDWLQSVTAVVERMNQTDVTSSYAMCLTVPDKDYCLSVSQALQEIAAERYTKVILSRAQLLDKPIDMAATLLSGRAANSPKRTFMLRQGGREAVGFSPELVMSVEQGRVVSEPLAGTRMRHENVSEGETGADLLSDAKEVIEHVITLRAALDELHAVCLPGSVVINELMSIRTRGSVCHLGSQVSGQLTPNKDAWDAFDVLFPGITASGVPKAPALEAISRLETAPRELYSGAVLWLEGQTRFEAALVLRAAFQDDNRQWVQAGAGIIAQSTPARELTETQEKLSSIVPYLRWNA